MRRKSILNYGFCLIFILINSLAYSQEAKPVETQSAVVENLERSDNVSLDFKEADIRNVLKIISFKAGVNIVPTSEVMGNVTIRLTDVPWEKALDVILKTYGFAYDKQGSIIMVAPLDKLTTQKKQEAELAQIQPTNTVVFTLKYLDAQDTKKALESQLSPRGKITVLEMTGQGGWEFGTTSAGSGGSSTGKRKRLEEKPGRSKVLIISDIPPVIDNIREVIDQIDVKPVQVLIESRIMEVSKDRLKDIGFDWGTGTAGANGFSTPPSDVNLNVKGNKTIAGRNLASEFTPGVFNPKEGTTVFPGTYPYKAGLEVLFKKLGGTQFEVILHALEEDAHTNTLSAPRILALNNQEATILVGTKYPILKQDTTGAGSTAVQTVTLDYYQDIGIQLNVVPQVGANNYINMIVHPAVSSFTSTLGTNAYPIIDTREAETRVLMRDGETIVIGGLLKDVKSREDLGIPFLSKIPLLGPLFKRNTVDNTKIDLLIFITARIIKESGEMPPEVAQMQETFSKAPGDTTVKKK